MDTKIAVILSVLCALIIFSTTDASGSHKSKKITIHVPYKVEKHKHTHTIVKNIHHHHKPTVIKEEKIIKHEIHKPIRIKEEIDHEHVHHHYKHDHPEISEHHKYEDHEFN